MVAWVVRSAVVADAEALARIHEAGRAAANIPNLHDFASCVAFHRDAIELEDTRVCVSADDEIAGYAVRWTDRLEQLYVAPAAFRTGVGNTLVRDGLMRAGAPLQLWCFSHNSRALAFYGRLGGEIVEHDDGSDNEEGLPAVKIRIPFQR